MRVDAMRLGNETMILLVSELPQNPIFITILSDYPHLKNNKKVLLRKKSNKSITKSSKIF